MLSSSLPRKFFSIFKGRMKHLNIKSMYCFKKDQMITNIIDEDVNKHIEDEVKSQDPIEAVIFSLNLCKVKTFQFHLKKMNIVKHVECVSFHTYAQFDGRRFTGELNDHRTFEKIDMDLQIKIRENTPIEISKEEFISKCEEISNFCPVYYTLKAAGIPIKLNFELI
eukprot:CAMPEP_0170516044 /NCGR_PEP_ID=MMETSP0209-20121228/2394_1 /TAXON_ID=665100 ORGANISM="Litonotus pictus, Strain P1" /NCGR_SAMPLE_ID=MMETSP0209 /ASSEMBLY_ACC=CAM_ASM_000301 /LENGTH=166 /DNA_ID=CAMNT_0010800809 /DNA_START=1 /DNA_END=501 /DNA_ORIENTATION=-